MLRHRRLAASLLTLASTVSFAQDTSSNDPLEEILGVNLQNVFDEEYATRLSSAQHDDGSGAFIAERLDVPRTYGVSCMYEF